MLTETVTHWSLGDGFHSVKASVIKQKNKDLYLSLWEGDSEKCFKKVRFTRFQAEA